jgi:hypothetical protein
MGTLAEAFGVRFHNGCAVEKGVGGIIRFEKGGGRLREHAITRGIDAVMTFQGSAFQAEGSEPLLVFGPEAESCVWAAPGGAGAGKRVSTVEAGGWLQGAVLRHGQGRVAVFGEAAMFSAQLAGADQRPMGMNHPLAAGNALFLLNVLRWLTAD